MHAGLKQYIFKAADIDSTNTLSIAEALVAFKAFAAGDTDVDAIRSEAIASSRPAGDDGGGGSSSSLGSVLSSPHIPQRCRWKTYGL